MRNAKYIFLLLLFVNQQAFAQKDSILKISLVKTIHFLREEGHPREIHIVVAIACTVGIEYVLREEPKATIWSGDIDDELTAKGYIVPGLGDAGDRIFGTK